MSIPSINTKRSAAKTAVSELTELARGVHTAQQRSDKIEQCKALLVDQAIDVLDTRRLDSVSDTKDFFGSELQDHCEAFRSYHTALGGTFMRELFCDKPVERGNFCATPPAKPIFPEGPLVMTFPSGTDVHTCLYGFQGTITYQDNTVVEYTEPTHLHIMDLPDDGGGQCTLMLRGKLAHRSQNERGNELGLWVDNDHTLSLWQWGDECVIEDYHEFFRGANLPCFGIDAEDSPKFGVQPNGDVYGETTSKFFNGATYFDSDISHWNMSQCINTAYMFRGCIHFNQPLESWNMSNVVDINYMFWNARSFNQPLNGWDVSSVKDFQYAFKDTDAFNQPLDQWDTSSGQSFHYMFNNAFAFNQPLNSWNMENAYRCHGMFYGAHAFNQPLDQWLLLRLIEADSMFRDTPNFYQDISSWVVHDNKWPSMSNFNLGGILPKAYEPQWV